MSAGRDIGGKVGGTISKKQRPKTSSQIKLITSQIAKLEGKSHQSSIGDVREIIGILSDIIYNANAEELDVIINAFKQNGHQRRYRKKD